mgnify:CR=1 FL=1
MVVNTIYALALLVLSVSPTCFARPSARPIDPRFRRNQRSTTINTDSTMRQITFQRPTTSDEKRHVLRIRHVHARRRALPNEWSLQSASSKERGRQDRRASPARSGRARRMGRVWRRSRAPLHRASPSASRRRIRRVRGQPSGDDEIARRVAREAGLVNVVRHEVDFEAVSLPRHYTHIYSTAISGRPLYMCLHEATEGLLCVLRTMWQKEWDATDLRVATVYLAGSGEQRQLCCARVDFFFAVGGLQHRPSQGTDQSRRRENGRTVSQRRRLNAGRRAGGDSSSLNHRRSIACDHPYDPSPGHTPSTTLKRRSFR